MECSICYMPNNDYKLVFVFMGLSFCDDIK